MLKKAEKNDFIPQVDGGPEMSDSSSEEEEDEEEHISRLVERIEEKVNESGAVDLNPKPQTMPAARLPQKPVVVQAGKPGMSTMGLQQDGGASTSDPNMVQYVANAEYLNSSVNFLSQMQYGQNNLPQFVLPNGQQMPSNVMMVPVTLDATGNVVLTSEQLKNAGFLSQVDGNADFEDFDFKSNPNNYKVNLDLNKGELVIKKKKDSMKKLTKEFGKLNAEKGGKNDFIPQVDGGPEMSDSSSEEEEDEEEHISRLVERIEDKAEEDEEGGDEEPLNSADDQSDDEDLDTLFDSRNIIVCQFEKVNRARTKWKFTLKDGIMHLDGKDYCFQKCTGEAEW